MESTTELIFLNQLDINQKDPQLGINKTFIKLHIVLYAPSNEPI
jgi:hypothetical protein